MRMSRRLALYHHEVGGKVSVLAYGAPSETITLTTANGESFTATTNEQGIAVKDGTAAKLELPLGVYTVVGSVSKGALASRTVTVDKNTTVVTAYPAGAVFWFGNGDTDGDTLFDKCGGWTAANISYSSGSRMKPSLVTADVLYAQGSLSGIGSSSGYYGTVYMNNAIDVSGANNIYISNCRNNYNGSALSRIGVINGTTIAQGYSFHKFADVSSTSYVTTSLDVSSISNCIVANGLFAKYYGGTGAVYSRIQAIWTE